jgi:hypothetical protein
MDYRNPVYNVFDTIDCEINHPEYGWIPFTCDPDDKGALFDTAALFEEMKSNAAPYVPPLPPTDEELAAVARANRDAFLAASDWTQLPDVPDVIREVWAVYRQALRDVPQQEGFPQEIVWPSSP